MGLNKFDAEAYIDDFSLITIVARTSLSISPAFTLFDADGFTYPLTIVKQEEFDQQHIYKCNTSVTIDLSKEYWVSASGHRIPVKMGSIVRTEQFDSMFFMEGSLGAIHSPESTTFKVWSPVAVAMLIQYQKSDTNELMQASMERTEKGVWRITLEGNHHLTQYRYLAKVNHEWVETTDPYARSVTINGEKSVVINLRETDPEIWNRSEKKMNLRPKTDSIIYELHIRDFTIHEDSGVKHKGKYLGLTEKNTKTTLGNSTGLDYLTSLGVSHVQLMPVADFGSVDESRSDEQYNWGYDPVHFFAPEGSYATDPNDPVCRIKELKSLIQSLQGNGLSVILDVVFNHVYKREESAFEKLVPGYYFRYDEGGNPVNGTGVGNDTASERKMMRKFIIDALTFWMIEYKIDGFRFDLMGIHDVETMSIAAKRLKSLNPGLFLLGEGWDLNTYLAPEKKAALHSAKKLPDYSFFNDSFRDCVKGSIFPNGTSGFINGNEDHGLMNQMMHAIKGFAGKYDTFLKPEQSINFTECHDNHTLHDLLLIRHPHETEKIRRKRQQLALAFTLLSHGVPFIHAGQEFFRTKKGIENSYNMPDEINRMNWNECDKNQKEIQYFRELLKIRREQLIFRDAQCTLFQKRALPNSVFGVEIQLSLTDKKEKNSYWDKVLLLFNHSLKVVRIPLIGETWSIAIEDEKRCLNEKASESYFLNPLSFSLLYKE
ncbi:type I pullulanase [Fictibacillus nanhaiensis]|uniref:type I pullulanase n=1 Tax=Fictibacillus nanhaiensis TaxID=742169 RepID=UPI001C9470AD|nr:type I pullulanase [Fictibacillus nanhaiensis]MBY6035135.1 type I pullulanase [Fictibacillus nanhaiensis]